MSDRLPRPAGLAAMLLALSVLTASPAVAGLADRVGATFALMSDEVIQVFQPMQGVVVAIDGDTIYFDVGAGAGARIGQEFTVFRKGGVFTHPLTGKPLGRYEEVLGHAQVRSVKPQFAQAVFVPLLDRPAPQPEDGVRITRGRLRVGVTPVIDLTAAKADLRRVPFLLASMLERSKRFQVVDPLVVGETLANNLTRAEEVLARPERAVGAARTLEVAGWLVPVLLERSGVVYLDVTWISAITGTPLMSRRQALLPPGGAEEQRFPWEPRVED